MTTTTNNLPLEKEAATGMALAGSAKDASTTTSSEDAHIYNRFPAHMHQYVEVALVYAGEDLLQSKLTDAEFSEHVTWFADLDADQQKQDSEDRALFAGVGDLLRTGQIQNAQSAALLSGELAQGQSSLLMRFISLQDLASPLDAAVSFLAWNHARALFDLEYEFGINLDGLRDLRISEFFGTSESQMTLCNFSVLSKVGEAVR